MKIYQMQSEQDIAQFKTLSIEYLTWSFEYVAVNFGFQTDDNIPLAVRDYIDNDLTSVSKLMPPIGQLLLVEIDGEIAAMSGMSHLRHGIAEIQKMYVRSQFRGRGIARKLLVRLINNAKDQKYSSIYLDSANFMASAHGLYRSVGFEEIAPYEGANVPEGLMNHWLFFELSLADN